MKLLSLVTAISALALGAAVDRTPLFDFYKGIEKSKIVLAINCGSDTPITDDDGVTYEADKYFDGGVMSSEGANHRWMAPNTDIYHSERWAKDKKMTYKLPISSTGTFTLILKFSEVYFEQLGEKVFDVYLGTTPLLLRLDILSRAGAKMLPHDEFFEFEIKRGHGGIKEVYFQGSLVNKAYTDDGELKIEFRRGSADNPKINSIIIVKGDKSNTHFENWMNYK